MKVNSVFLKDSTAVSDSVLLLFGGSILQGEIVSSSLLSSWLIPYFVI